MVNPRYRWFRPVVPCMLIGFLGWLPDINGSTISEAKEGFACAALGLCFGLILDAAVHGREPPVPPVPSSTVDERRKETGG